MTVTCYVCECMCAHVGIVCARLCVGMQSRLPVHVCVSYQDVNKWINQIRCALSLVCRLSLSRPTICGVY